MKIKIEIGKNLNLPKLDNEQLASIKGGGRFDSDFIILDLEED